MAEVTFEPGVEFRMAGASFEVFNANLIVAGTEDAPVVFTSSASAPAAGDWGCIHFSSVTGRPSFDHAVIEYAGSGAGCTGANYLTALTVPADAVITNSTFREISGTAIRSQSACPLTKAAWCANVFEEVAEGPVSCQLGNDLGCP